MLKGQTTTAEYLAQEVMTANAQAPTVDGPRILSNHYLGKVSK